MNHHATKEVHVTGQAIAAGEKICASLSAEAASEYPTLPACPQCFE
jgi:hypothetical protein